MHHCSLGALSRVSALAFAVAVAPTAAAGQAYPSRDIVLLCAFPAGSGADVIVRYFGEKVRPLTGRTVIVQNVPGAGGNIAAEQMIRSKPDGHTIFVHAGNTVASNQHLIKSNPIDAAKQVRIAATINRQGFFVTTHTKSPWKTLPELTAAMKEKGDKATYATSANSGVILGALYAQKAGLSAVEVRYRMGPDSLKEMESGRVDYGLHDPQIAMQEARKGNLRLLAIATGERMKSTPDVPTMSELGYTMDLQGWFAAMVPMQTPEPIVRQINAWFNQVIETKDAKDFLESFGGEAWASTPEVGQERLVKDLHDWVDYIRAGGLTPQ